MVVELDAQLLGALVDVLAVHAGGERRLLQLLPHRLRLEPVEPGRADERARVHEAGELVAGEQHLLQRRVARQPQMLGVGEHRLDDLLRIALLAEDRSAVLRMLVERGVDLVVEVVEQRRDAPELLVPVEPRRVRGGGGLDRERVPQQRFALRVLRERLPGLFAGRSHDPARIASRGRGSRPRRRILHRGRAPAERPHPCGREQERSAADPRRMPAHGRRGAAAQRAADPRRPDDARPARRPRGRGRVARGERSPRPGGERDEDGARRGALQQDPRVGAARRPAARPVRQRHRPAARRRRDRPPPRRHAPPRVPEARRRDRGEPPLHHAHRRPRRRQRLPRRGERHRHGERRHGGDARARRDDARQRRVRAARPGSLPLPRRARRGDRGHRDERAARHRRRVAARRGAHDRARPHRGGELHRPRRDHRGRDRDRELPPGGSRRDHAGLQRGSASGWRSRARASASPTDRTC